MRAHQRNDQGEARENAAMRGVREDRRALGASPHLSDLRRHALLRLVAQQAREPARARNHAPGYRFSGAWGALVVLLSGRRVCGVLASADSSTAILTPVTGVRSGGSLAGNDSSSASSTSAAMPLPYRRFEDF